MLVQNAYILNSLLASTAAVPTTGSEHEVLYWLNTAIVSIIVLIFAFILGGLFWIAHLTKTEAEHPLTDFQKAIHIFSLIVVEAIIIGSPFVLALMIAIFSHMLGDNFHTKALTPEKLAPYFLAFLFLCVPQTLFLVPPIRKAWLKVAFPNLDYLKTVHKLAAFFYMSIAGLLAFNIFVSYDPHSITHSVVAVSQTFTAAAQTLGYIIICLLGLGVFARRSPKQIAERLGLSKISLTTFYKLLGITAILLIASLVLEHLALQVTPKEIINVLRSFVGSMNETPHWSLLFFNAVIISLSAGIGEELIFRGLLQPRFGWIGSNVLFALMHIYYGPTALLLVLFIIGLGFGWVRRKWNTTASIIVHVLYDFIMLVGPVILYTLTGTHI